MAAEVAPDDEALPAGEILVVAGEASGDLHGAALMRALLARRPGLRFFGLGGDRMAAAGLDPLGHSRDIAVVGLFEALRVLPRARRLFQELLRGAAARQPRAAILIDSPDFNLRLARRLKQLGIPVVYYVSPQVWAWRQGRVKVIAERVDKMLVLFPFEVSFYEAHDVVVRHVGHPLVDEVPRREQAWDRFVPEQDDGRRRLVLLPGSRDSEVEALLPIMLRTAAELERLLGPERALEVQLVQASTVRPELIERHLAVSTVAVERVREDRFEAIASAHLVLCASGTATLEVGLIGTPLIVLYRVSRLTALLGRLLVRVPFISLVNLVLEREAAPELVQGDVEPGRICRLALPLLLGGEAVTAMRRDLGALRDRLGEGGASERAADEVASLLDERGASCRA